MRRVRLFAIYHLPFTIAALAACAPSTPRLPAGDGTPFPGFASAYAQATEHCNVKSISAVLSLSGRVGSQKLRGRVDAGLAEPDRMVLEAVAPFGKPFFVMGATGGAATLVLPRDGRVLRGAASDAIVEALTGVSLTPEQMRGVLAGCGIPSAAPVGGRTFGDDWASIDTGGGTAMWLRRMDGRWRLVASTQPPIAVHYSDFAPTRPATVRLRATTAGGTASDITLRLSDVDVNVPLDEALFNIAVPKDAVPLTLEELRRAGPLGR